MGCTHVALSGSTVATATTTASGSGSAVSGEVTNTATGLAENISDQLPPELCATHVASSGLGTTVATTTTAAVVASYVTGLWAVSGLTRNVRILSSRDEHLTHLVTWLTTSVALATAGEAASGSTGTGTLGALGGKVSLLTTGVTGSGLGGWALSYCQIGFNVASSMLPTSLLKCPSSAKSSVSTVLHTLENEITHGHKSSRWGCRCWGRRWRRGRLRRRQQKFKTSSVTRIQRPDGKRGHDLAQAHEESPGTTRIDPRDDRDGHTNKTQQVFARHSRWPQLKQFPPRDMLLDLFPFLL